MARKLINWIPAFIVMAFIFLLSATPGPVLDAAGFGSEAIHVDGHFLIFTLLCITYYKATKNIVVSLLLCFAYAVSDEIHQLWTPFRSCSFFDVFVDSLGSLLSGAILWKLQPYLPKILKNWLQK